MPAAPDPVAKPQCLRDDAVAVVRTLRGAGHVAYFAGGCVRDVLLGAEPTDYDVATDAEPARVRALFRSTQAVGAAFGVILVRLGRSVVEVATFRTDLAYADGRRPTGVRFTTAAEDARRRDFTINGLFLDPLTGDVIDHVGGQADLRAKIVRAIGEPDQRFAEDHLRLLRAVRFAARLSFEIEPRTAAAVRAHAPQLKRISPERIADELRRMLTAPTRAAAWAMLWDLALAAEVFRMLPPRQEEPRPSRDAFASLDGDDVGFGLALATASLAYTLSDKSDDVRPLLEPKRVVATVNAARQSLRISNDESDAMRGTLDGAAAMLAGPFPAVAQMKRLLAKPHAPDVRRLLAAVAATGRHADRIGPVLADLAKLEAAGDVAPPPLVTGDDLTAAGLRPGPAFKRVLDAVYDAQLEGRAATRDEAMAMALDLAR